MIKSLIFADLVKPDSFFCESFVRIVKANVRSLFREHKKFIDLDKFIHLMSKRKQI